MQDLLDLVIHLDVHLNNLLLEYGVWTYAILFLIIFCETGLVVTPFLPGDSLLFAAGALTALEHSPLSVVWLSVLLSIAAFLGDTLNYRVGIIVGPRAFSGRIRWLNTTHLEYTHRFYEQYGGRTIVLGRFIPIIRTFAPFVAGIGRMTYSRFLLYNITGGIGWVWSFLFLGYFFGSHPIVKSHFSIVILAVILISLAPGIVQYIRFRYTKKNLAK